MDRLNEVQVAIYEFTKDRDGYHSISQIAQGINKEEAEVEKEINKLVEIKIVLQTKGKADKESLTFYTFDVESEVKNIINCSYINLLRPEDYFFLKKHKDLAINDLTSLIKENEHTTDVVTISHVNHLKSLLEKIQS
ncbi:hypothetical protein [Paenibacillus sp. HW567]|uniref:hypothetical protein n=1 Tax=Paenibacillus sp. HW567 TaxID=1034769 RepID=UPI00036C1B88|nr:hypothetical protein [Paenibacillus sp. HW567]